MNKYYSLMTEGSEANINIYGDITSWPWKEGDVSSYTLSKEIDGLDVDVINVYINSCGGEVPEGWAIYNALKRHNAKIKTFGDGFMASIASVIFMAGDERIMSNVSLIFLHNAWSYVAGNANELRKQADDLETMTQISINAFMDCVNITEEKLKELHDAETWVAPKDALEMGFATSIVNDNTNKGPSQSVKKLLFQMLTKPLETEPKPVEPKPVPVPEEPIPKENQPLKLLQALFR